jgi:predicted RNA-binding protein with PUA-like domain
MAGIPTTFPCAIGRRRVPRTRAMHETRTSAPMHTGVMNWLVKEEPSNYNYASFQKDGRTVWSGVRNPVAQKHLRAMQPGDRVFFYHTGGEKAIVGTARVAGAPYSDPANADGSLAAVDLTCETPLPVPVTLKAVKADPRFADFALTRVPRLSVMPVTDAQWAMLVDMAKG